MSSNDDDENKNDKDDDENEDEDDAETMSQIIEINEWNNWQIKIIWRTNKIAKKNGRSKRVLALWRFWW